MPMLPGRIKFILCVLFTYISIIYSDYFVIRWIVGLTLGFSLSGALIIILYNIIILFLTFAHYKAVLTDPGYIPFPQTKVDFSDMHTGAKDEDDDSWPVCDKCETYTPPRAHHCRFCNRCVKKMDRHCYGINNCVGEENQKYFVQFLFYTDVLFTYCLMLVVQSVFMDCLYCTTDELNEMRILNSSLLGVLCAIFIISTSVHLAQQIKSILLGITTIEQAQKKYSFRPRKPKYFLAAEVFGSYNFFLWFIPCYQGKIRKFSDSLLSHIV